MEDKEANQDHNHPSLLPHNNHNTTNTTTPKEESHSLRKPTGGGGGGDRLKRDEWSEGAVSTLLEAYEAKWALRNRAKLKGHDWEDIARCVSSRANSTKSPKTQTQCKNKIESMKKKYRSESATAEASTWPLYSRLDLLLRGTGPASTPTPTPTPPPPPPPPPTTTVAVAPLMVLEPLAAVSQPPLQPPPLAAPPPLANAQNSHGSNGVDNRLTKEDGLGTKSSHEHVYNKNPTDTNRSTPAVCSEKQDNSRCNNKRKMLKMKNNMNIRRRRTNKVEMEIGESLRWLTEVVVRSEQARMETIKEIERMRVEAEAKRGEMDLKRTEIIANSQLEIARIFARANKGVDSSLGIGRS